MSIAIPLTKLQAELMEDFYSLPLRKVLFPKRERDALWKSFKNTRLLPRNFDPGGSCPALAAEIAKALTAGQNLQSAIFSECVYAQALADHFGLTEFASCAANPRWLTGSVEALLRSYNLVARYLYKNTEGSRILIQAGGNGGVDGALISVIDNNIFTIEFKEPVSKVSELDLPKYAEDGNLLLTDDWAGKYPHFLPMIREQIALGLNFWVASGANVHGFTPASVQQAVSENYTGKKFADVICTEDSRGFLTMVPANQAHHWAKVKGEIRPAGRNPNSVWTPSKLESIVAQSGGTVAAGVVCMPLSGLVPAAPRGGTGISRYKISPIFLVRTADVTQHDGSARFLLSHVRQNRPTISAHMDFKGLKADNVMAYYLGGI